MLVGLHGTIAARSSKNKVSHTEEPKSLEKLSRSFLRTAAGLVFRLIPQTTPSAACMYVYECTCAARAGMLPVANLHVHV